jgi:ribonuclease-3
MNSNNAECTKYCADSESSNYTELENALGYSFKDKEWLVRALTHKSILETSSTSKDYERLEFLGDATLDLIVAHLLLDAHKDVKEGDLSKMRAALVNTNSLAEIAKDLNISKYVRVSKSQLASKGHERPSLLADVLEAILGAIYRDGGYEEAFNTTKKLFGVSINTVLPSDPKTELQEILHTLGSGVPTYLLEYTEGPEHSPTFVSIVQVDGTIVGRGSGPTKKASQQAAAKEALLLLQNKDDIDRLFLINK